MNISIKYKNDPHCEEVQKKVCDLARKYGHILRSPNPEIIIFVGGDGTFLRILQDRIKKVKRVKCVGVNCGNLGFFYDYDENNIEDFFKDLRDGNLQERTYPLLEVKLQNRKSKKTYYAVNEVRIENPFHTLVSDVMIDGQYFETFKGNGLMVSSPLGSTAYSKSIGGAVISEPLKVLQLTEIAAINNKVTRSLGSPLIVGGNKTIAFTGDFSNVVMGYDHLTIDATDIKSVSISLSKKYSVTLLCSKNYSHIEKIRKCFIE